MIQYSITNDGILQINIKGKTSANDLRNYLNEFGNNDNLPKELLTFYNLRNADMNLNLLEIVSVAKLAKKVTSHYKSVRTAFLVNKPNVTAYSMLFIQAPSNRKSKRKVFSTKEAAINWLLDKE